MNIAHYVGGKFLGLITPDTQQWRDHSISVEIRHSRHYERKPKKVQFFVLSRGQFPPQIFPK